MKSATACRTPPQTRVFRPVSSSSANPLTHQVFFFISQPVSPLAELAIFSFCAFFFDSPPPSASGIHGRIEDPEKKGDGTSAAGGCLDFIFHQKRSHLGSSLGS